MTLPSSGQLSINDIAGEFGGSVPHALSEYYGVSTGIPSSGEISISDFYGSSAVSKTFLGSNFTLSGNPISASFSFGTAAPSRIIVGFVLGYGGSLQNIGFTGATIGGVSATFAGSTLNAGVDGSRLAGFYASIPTGTSGTISVSCSGGTPPDAGLIAYAVYGSSFVKVVDYDASGTVTLSTNVSANQVLLGAAGGNNSGGTRAWTGLTSDAAGDIRSNEYFLSASHLTTTAQSPRTITNNYASTTDDNLGKLLVFGP